MTVAKAIVQSKASGDRLRRNTLVFLAADVKRLEELERGVAELMAWTEIYARWEELGLDAFQRNQAETKKRESERAVELRVGETYQWALVPYQPDPIGVIEWETVKADGQGSLPARVARKLTNAGSMMSAYPAELLRGLLDGGPLASVWNDGHVSVNKLWDEYFARYPYLPRLRNLEVLIDTAKNGPASMTWEQHGFAVADAVDANGRYVGLVVSQIAPVVTGASLIVRPDKALAQVGADLALAEERQANATGSSGLTSPSGQPRPVPGAPAPADTAKRRFYAIAKLDPERAQRDFAKLANEIITSLAGQLGTDLEITVEIQARNPEGFTEPVIRTVSENARTLKLDASSFEQE